MLRWLVLLAACKSSSMMDPIPGATIERWTTALEAVCSEYGYAEAEPTPDNPIAASKVRFICTLKPELADASDKAAGFIQRDRDERPSRITFEVQSRRKNQIMNDVLARWGLTPGEVRKLAGDDIVEIDGASYSIVRVGDVAVLSFQEAVGARSR